MAKKIVWLVVSCLILLSLVFTSCGTKEEEETKVTEEGGQVVTTKEGAKEEKEVVQEEGLLPPDVPKYGGTVILTDVAGQNYFDPLIMSHTMGMTNVYLDNEELLTGNWAKGPAGTKENTGLFSFAGRMDLMTGWLAESWEIPDEETMIFHIRQGVHWWNKPPTNGRELNANDVVWTMERVFSQPKSYYYTSFTIRGENPTSIKALDKYTVEVKVPSSVLGVMLLEIGDRLYIFPPEPTELYGDMSDWRNAIGTGAWMLTDFVPANSITFTKNPDYWQNDPLHPENQLPYPDKMLCLLITDASTRLAAFRTGQLDSISLLVWDDFSLLKEQHPELEYVETYPDIPSFLCGRVDKPELPFNDIRVRQALNMAINKQEIIDEYYSGHAVMLFYPCPPTQEFSPFYTPLEEQPEAVQELFEYNPEKARQLLAEAGYPNGFKTVVQCTSATVDYLSLIREYLLKVNIDMSIETLDTSVYSSVSVGRTFKEMIISQARTSLPFMLLDVRIDQQWDKALWQDPRVDDTYLKISAALGRDDAEVARLVREIGPYILEQASNIWLPQPNYYTMWWPWLQNYYGVQDLGYCSQGRWRTFLWVDEALKKSMGY